MPSIAPPALRPAPRLAKLVFMFAAALLAAACSDLERTNPLDPKNPNSFNSRVVLAELFVNDNVPCDTLGNYCPASAYAEAALESLYTEFSRQRLVYAQFHIGQQYHDGLDHPANLDHYRAYVAAHGDSVEAVPDVFINGPGTRLLGASTFNTAYDRMRGAIAGGLDQRSFFSIEGSFSLSADSTRVSASARIARLGATASASDLKACFLVINDTGQDDHHFVVWGISSVNLPSIDHGDIHQISTQTISLTGPLTGTAAVIVYIKDTGLQVLQAALFMSGE